MGSLFELFGILSRLLSQKKILHMMIILFHPKPNALLMARLIKKVYEVDPLICPKCQSEMRVMSVITDRTEVIRILRHLFKIGRAPPGVELADLEGAG